MRFEAESLRLFRRTECIQEGLLLTVLHESHHSIRRAKLTEPIATKRPTIVLGSILRAPRK